MCDIGVKRTVDVTDHFESIVHWTYEHFLVHLIFILKNFVTLET